MKFALRLAAATSLVAVLATSHAAAEDGRSFVDRAKERATASGATFDAGTVTERGAGSFTIENSTVSGPRGRVLQIERIEGEGYARTEGAVKADRLSATGLATEEKDGVVVSVGEVTVSDLNYPTPDNTAVDAIMQLYSSAVARDIAMTIGGQSIMSIASAQVTMSKASDTSTSSRAQVDGFQYDVEKLPDSAAKSQIIAVGYPQITGSMTAAGTYDIESGIVDVTDTTIAVDDAATLSVTYSIGGYTREIAEKMNALNAKYAANPSSPDAMQDILPLVSQLTLRAANITLTDASLTGKMLALQSKSMGSTPAQLAEMAPMFITMGMQRLQMPELSASVAAAVGTFLKDQGSLSITLAPAEPVPFSQIVIASQVNPRSLPALLNLGVEGR